MQPNSDEQALNSDEQSIPQSPKDTPIQSNHLLTSTDPKHPGESFGAVKLLEVIGLLVGVVTAFAILRSSLSPIPRVAALIACGCFALAAFLIFKLWKRSKSKDLADFIDYARRRQINDLFWFIAAFLLLSSFIISFMVFYLSEDPKANTSTQSTSPAPVVALVPTPAAVATPIIPVVQTDLPPIMKPVGGSTPDPIADKPVLTPTVTLTMSQTVVPSVTTAPTITPTPTEDSEISHIESSLRLTYDAIRRNLLNIPKVLQGDTIKDWTDLGRYYCEKGPARESLVTFLNVTKTFFGDTVTSEPEKPSRLKGPELQSDGRWLVTQVETWTYSGKFAGKLTSKKETYTYKYWFKKQTLAGVLVPPYCLDQYEYY